MVNNGSMGMYRDHKGDSVKKWCGKSKDALGNMAVLNRLCDGGVLLAVSHSFDLPHFTNVRLNENE